MLYDRSEALGIIVEGLSKKSCEYLNDLIKQLEVR